MLMTAGRMSSPGNIFLKPEKICRIHLEGAHQPNEIRGKAQICDLYEIQHFGIVVELEGTITFSDRFKDVIKIFAPDKDSPTVMRSTVYCQIAGRPEGLTKIYPRHQLLKKLTPRSHIFEFKLDLPTSKPLPASLTTELVDVTYTIIVYKRTPDDNYEIMEQKPLKFYGYHDLLPDEDNIQPHLVVKEFLDPGIQITLQTPKSNYLRNEFIPFTITIIRAEKLQTIGNISAVLLKSIFVFEKSSTEIVDTFLCKKTSNRKEFIVRGVFKASRKFPTYNYSGVHGLKLKYCIKCDIFNRDSQIIASVELEVGIGTLRIQRSLEENVESVPPFRSRCMSLASSMLSLFPPTYSNLPSRSGSITSLETLPPHYDDLQLGPDSVAEEQNIVET